MGEDAPSVPLSMFAAFLSLRTLCVQPNALSQPLRASRGPSIEQCFPTTLDTLTICSDSDDDVVPLAQPLDGLTGVGTEIDISSGKLD